MPIVPTTRGLLVVLSFTLLLAGSASAQQVLPPGNAGIDEYTENVPAAGGDKPGGGTGGTGGGGGAAGDGADEAQTGAGLPSAIAEQLREAGPDGAAAADLAAATGPATGSAGERGGSAGNGAGTEAGPGVSAAGEVSPNASGDSALSEILSSIVGGSTDDDEGAGPLFPLAVAAIAIGALAFGVARWRRRIHPSGS